MQNIERIGISLEFRLYEYTIQEAKTYISLNGEVNLITECNLLSTKRSILIY